MSSAGSFALVIGACLAAVAGCTSAPGAAPDAKAATGPAVQLRFDSLAASIRRLDVERMLEFYAPDSAIIRAIDSRLLVGRPQVERDFREGFASVRSIDRLAFPERHLSVLGPDAAVLTVRVEEAFTDRAGARTALRGTWTSAWLRRHGTWYVVQDAAVHVPAPQAR